MTPTVYGDPLRVYAKPIADSVTPYGDRLTTLEVQTHRYMLPEFNTHRAFSRNSASSRAIPFRKMAERVIDNPAIPTIFRREQSGMQGGEVLFGNEADAAQRTWLAARDAAVWHATTLHNQGVHKSIVNRILEPFMWHRIIVSSTEWDNFLVQRDSPLAQDDIHRLAEHVRAALKRSEPSVLGPDEWHTPYVTPGEKDELGPDALKVSAARCARVSYLTHDGVRDLAKDIALYERLVSAEPPHWSPLEHVARPTLSAEVALGNFQHWQQLRHILSR